MPDGTLEALVAFVAEHQRCGELDGGVDNGYVWLQCSCDPQHRWYTRAGLSIS